MTVEAGQTVRWRNTDRRAHRVVSGAYRPSIEKSQPEGLFDYTLEGRGDVSRYRGLQPDDAAVFTFQVPGSYPYYCALHPGMAGTIIVEP